jgi:hypothetical protein
MESHDPLDDEIRSLVRSVEKDAPADLERDLPGLAPRAREMPQARAARRPFLIASIAGAAVLLLAILTLVPERRDREAVPIAEIRTEFLIADKNITIIFIQQPEFPVFMTAF